MTDASQATVWDGVFDPFGEEVAITGLAAIPMRFPGQYADDETGFSYNYFRDYDPSLGRYIQSDPIGLSGGFNVYAYVGGNPTGWVDHLGLIKLPPTPGGLPEGWEQDTTHKDPTGTRWRNKSGGCLDHHPGEPGEPGWGGKDHWHDCTGGRENKEKRKRHWKPGEECPQPGDKPQEPVPPEEQPKSWWEKLPPPIIAPPDLDGGGGFKNPFLKDPWDIKPEPVT
jgi:RHS repeat-associated protein